MHSHNTKTNLISYFLNAIIVLLKVKFATLHVILAFVLMELYCIIISSLKATVYN